MGARWRRFDPSGAQCVPAPAAMAPRLCPRCSRYAIHPKFPHATSVGPSCGGGVLTPSLAHPGPTRAVRRAWSGHPRPPSLPLHPPLAHATCSAPLVTCPPCVQIKRFTGAPPLGERQPVLLVCLRKWGPLLYRPSSARSPGGSRGWKRATREWARARWHAKERRYVIWNGIEKATVSRGARERKGSWEAEAEAARMPLRVCVYSEMWQVSIHEGGGKEQH